MSAIPGLVIPSGAPVSPGGLRGPSGSDVPTGVTFGYVGSIAPEGFLWCNGALHLTDDFPELFSLIGYTFGGAGSDFGVPTISGQIIKT